VGSTYNLSYDAENRLTSVSGGATASFAYDGDGNRVKGTVNGVTTVYVGNYYELSGSTTRTYYYAGSTRVAMKENSNVFFLLADHLGGTAVTANSSGGWYGEVRYYAYGGTRYNQGTTPTTYRYTGQRQESGLGGLDGLYFYGARWYDPYLNRWIQPDSIVPQPGNPQSLNRFAYCLNNPLRYTDPTGHWTEEQLEQALGKDWREKYFGKGAVFENRDKLLQFLISDKTTDPNMLYLVAQFLNPAEIAHRVGMSFENIDALGARIAFSYGAAGFAGLNGDAVLNLSSGEFSIFLSPEGGFIIGESATVISGITLIKNLPSNDAYRGTFEAVGIVGGHIVGLNAEFFWGAPLSDQFNAFDNAHGGFIGAGPAIPGLGGYGSMSYSWEVYRENAQGSHIVPHRPNPLDVVKDVGWAVIHDILLHPLLPWSPYRH
jgi:RHS repeat-associated protein